MLHCDKPISKIEEDLLGRNNFIETLRNTIISQEIDSSHVIGITGKWGDGKTSVINILKREIRTALGSDTIICDFSPWKYAHGADYFKLFIEAIQKEIGRNRQFFRHRDWKKIERDLRKYSISNTQKGIIEIFNCQSQIVLSIFNILILLGVFNVFSQKVNFSLWYLVYIVIGTLLLSYLTGKISNNYNIHKKSLLELKNNLCEVFRNSKIKFLFIIDDFDRLEKNDVREIFRIVNENLDFPNTIYLLAYDPEIVRNAYPDFVGSGQEPFFEKIIQTALPLPIPSKLCFSKIIGQEVANLPIPDEIFQKYFQESERFAYLLDLGFLDFFENIRDVKRYFNSIRIIFDSVNVSGVLEIDPIDLIAIYGINFVSPECFQNISINEKLFLTETSSDRINQFLNTINHEKRGSIIRILCFLFSNVSSAVNSTLNDNFNISFPGYDSFSICKSFRKYFTLLPRGNGDGISNLMTIRMFEAVGVEEDFLEWLDEQSRMNLISYWLMTIVHMLNEHRIALENLDNIVYCLCEKCHEFPMTKEIFQRNNVEVIHQIVRIKLFGLSAMEGYLFIENILKRTTARSAIIPFILNLQNENGDYNKETGIKTDGWDIDKIFDSCFKIVTEDPSKFMESPTPLFILARLKLAHYEEYLNFLEKLLDDDEFIVKAITHSCGKRYGQFEPNKPAYQICYIQYSAFTELGIDLNQLKSRLESIKESNPKLYERFESTNNLFLRDFEKKDELGYGHGIDFNKKNGRHDVNLSHGDIIEA